MNDERIPITSPFDSVDPAPPSAITEIAQLRNTLCDENERMFQRMRALFALRNMGGNESVDALCAAFNSESALLKHEIAYVLGQMQMDDAVPTLINILSDSSEHVMVRHEAAEALGAIGNPDAIPVLKEFLHDEHIEVSESCEVALDLLDWVHNSSIPE